MRKEHVAFIEKEFRECVLKTIRRLEAEDTHRPFHATLLPRKVLLWSRFERSFSTSLGQRVIERVSKVAAESYGATHAELQKETVFELSHARKVAIDRHIDDLRHNRGSSIQDLESVIKDLRSIPSTHTKMGEVRVISDLWWRDKSGRNHYMSIKTVTPNLDQTAEAKRDLLRLKLAKSRACVHFGLYYNPFGKNRADYAWNPPKRIFNIATDNCVLIGKDYWDTLGGNGFYEELLKIVKRVGVSTRKRINASL